MGLGDFKCTCGNCCSLYVFKSAWEGRTGGGACRKALEALPRLLLRRLRRVVRRDKVREELRRVVVLRAGVPEGLKVAEGGAGLAAVDGRAGGEQQEVIEELEDAGARLVDGGDDGVAGAREPVQRLDDLRRMHAVEARCEMYRVLHGQNRSGR